MTDDATPPDPTKGAPAKKKAVAKKAQAKKKAVAKRAARAKKAPAKKTTVTKTAAPKKAPAHREGADRSSAADPRAPGERLDDGTDVVRAAAEIVRVLDDHPDLLLAAFTNPVRALQDAGFDLGPRAQRYVAHRCRFSPDEADELEELADEIESHLGEIDPDDDVAVRAALDEIGVRVTATSTTAAPKTSAASPAPPEHAATRTARGGLSAQRRATIHPARRSVIEAASQLPQVQRWRETARHDPDPLEEHLDAHEVISPLLEYRRRSSSQLRFGTDELYDRLAATRNGQLSAGINLTIRARLNTDGDG